MKRCKAVVALLLCIMLVLPLFAACGGDNAEGEVTYGRYVEEEITPEGYVGSTSSFHALEGGVLDVSTTEWVEDENSEFGGGTSQYYRWRSEDSGKTWQQMDMGWTREYIVNYTAMYESGQEVTEEVNLGQMIPFANGDLLAVIYTYNYSEYMSTASTELLRVSPNGSKAPYVLPVVEAAKEGDRSVSVDTMRALPGGRLYVNYSIQPTEEEMADPNYDWMANSFTWVCDMETGEQLYPLELRGGEIFFNENTLFINDYDNGFSAFNLADGTPANVPLPSEESIQSMYYGGAGMLLVDKDNNFFTLNNRGLKKLPMQSGGETSAASGDTGDDDAATAQETEMLMEGLNYTYGSPLFGIQSSTLIQQDGSILVSLWDTQSTGGSGSKLMRYVWDDEAVASSGKDIRVYSLYPSEAVRLGLSEFKRMNPEVNVSYDYAFDPYSYDGVMPLARAGSSAMSASGSADGAENGVTEADALTALNTELMNGTGPDILILDGLPIESFIKNGVLENLDAQVSGNSDLIQSVMQPLYKDGGIYAVPAYFYLPTLFGEKGYVEQFTSLDALLAAVESGAEIPPYQEIDPSWSEQQQEEYYRNMNGPKKEEDQPALYFNTLEDVFSMLYTTSASAVFSESGGVNMENLTAFLQAAKQICDRYNLTDPEQMAMYGSGKGDYYSSAYGSDEYSYTLSNYGNRRGRLGYSKLGAYYTLTDLSYNIHWSKTYEGKSLAMAEPVTIEDDIATDDLNVEGNGAAESSGNVETFPDMHPAAVLAPGLAQGVYVPSIMVGVTSTSKQKDLARSFVTAMVSENVQKHQMSSGFPVSRAAMDSQYSTYLAGDEYMKREGIELMPFDYEPLLSSLQTVLYPNNYLRDILNTAVWSYCTGEQPLEAAAQQVVKETEMYFAERQ